MKLILFEICLWMIFTFHCVKNIAISITNETAFAQGQVFQVCRNGWIQHSGSCYLISHTFSVWAEALAICRAFGGHLVDIETSEEDNFIKLTLQGKNKISANGYWIGLNDIEVKGNFKWISTNKELVHQNWHSGQPQKRKSENCGILWRLTKFNWHDNDCRDKNAYFICEK